MCQKDSLCDFLRSGISERRYLAGVFCPPMYRYVSGIRREPPAEQKISHRLAGFKSHRLAGFKCHIQLIIRYRDVFLIEGQLHPFVYLPENCPVVIHRYPDPESEIDR